MLQSAWYVWSILVLMTTQSLVFALASLPALAFWRWASKLNPPLIHDYAGSFMVAVSLIPSYFIFCLGLMYLSAGVNRLLRWRTEPGEYSVQTLNSKLIRWGSYNASIQLVRIFAGEFMRTGPFWTWYLKANGAKIGKHVYVNSTRLFDHNLITIGDKAVVGGDAKLIAHLVERGVVKADPVHIGRGAVIGVNSVIGPGVTVGDRSAVGAMSFVPKGFTIPPNEAWGGVPVHRLKSYGEDEDYDADHKPGVPVAA